MADKLAINAGKRLLGKKLAEDSKAKDAYKYKDYEDMRRGKPREKKKDEAYFRKLGIPKEDAKVLVKVMKRARMIDGKQVGPMRVGVGFFVDLVPAVGDAADGLLAMWIVKTASGVSGGLPKGVRSRMVLNVIIDVAIGLTPVLGDIADTFYQANTRNFKLLEDTLRKRVEESIEAAEKAGTVPVTERVHTNGHANGRTNGRTNDHQRVHAQADSSQSYDDRHAGLHKRMLAGPQKDSASSNPALRGGGAAGSRWASKLNGRGHNTAQAEDVGPALPSQPTEDTRGHVPGREGVATAHTHQPNSSRRHQVGSF